MTFTISSNTVYLTVIAVLMIMQIYQWTYIYKIKKELTSVWSQIAILVTSFATQVTKLENKINETKK
jgi:Flp pilus assembly pilin Flp